MKKNLKRTLTLLLTLALAATLACCTNPDDDSSSSFGGGSENSSQENSESSENSSESDSSSTQNPTEPTKAKVIVLAGQSNAVGHSYAKYLNQTVQAKYAAGFDNVQIYYSNYPYATSGYMNVNDEGFTKVTLGQGRNVDTTEHVYGNFGPEVGLAEYLSETYPEETFYIIKDATGGTRIWDRWYSSSSYGYRGGEAENSLYAHMMNWVDDGMELLEAQGLDAEIVSFAWMQGESDSLTYVREYGYLWSNFVKDIKADWSAKGYLPENGLSIIDAGITDRWTNYQTMNAVKKAYADTSSKNYFIDVHNSSWVSYDQDNTDYAHLDASAMIGLGRAFGENVKNAIEDLDNAEEYTYTGTGWDGFTKTTLAGTGTETDPYLISTEAELATLALNVKDGNTYEGKFIKLANDITITNPCFTGIGGANGNYNAYDTIIKRAFAGTFDGNNKTITVDLFGPSFTGLFRGNTGTVKNLTVDGNVTGGWYDVGAVVAYNYGGTVYNCVNKATLTSNYTDALPFHYGGVVGYSYGGTIENCTNLADIRMDGHTIGGIVGRVEHDTLVKGCVNGSATASEKGSITADYELGGIVGVVGTANTDGSIVENCINYMNILPTSTSNGKSGGIASVVYSNNTVKNSDNYGEITATYSRIGGITGQLFGSTIENCDNYANVTSTSTYVGGIVGYSETAGYTLSGCENTGVITGKAYVGGILGNDSKEGSTISSCTNRGEIIATGYATVSGVNSVRIGGIAGMSYGTLTDCENYGKITVQNATYAPTDTIPDAGTGENYRVGYIIGYKTSKCTTTNCVNNYVEPQE